MEFVFCIQQYIAWCRTGDGCIFSFFGKWSERAGDAQEKNVCHCRNLWFFSGINADDRLGMCSYHY